MMNDTYIHTYIYKRLAEHSSAISLCKVSSVKCSIKYY